MNKPLITQAMIDAYDEYTHLTLDRRGFMETLTRLAGSGAAAVAIAPMLATNAARAAVIADDDSRLKAEDVTYPGSGGDMKGYLARPADQSGKLGTVIVVHENRGLNAHIKDVARRVALEGYVALAPDFMSPLGGTPADEEKARQQFSTLDPAQVQANAVATVAFLKGHESGNGKVGAVGFCWGGGTVNMLAVNAPDLAAAVAYYGAQPKPEDVPKIKAPLLLHYAGLDERINAGIDAFRKALDENGKKYTLYIYEGANHAFNNETSEARYNKAAADLAWQRTVSFFKENLSA
ncbi:carboxymethylenebutenolidase [Mesorhizobium sp. Root554]|uniref:dienelactone hydrolase family protein n=1 Tax=unclassified Mesorhizobium TaxID=325217 RepID=UPI0006F7D009|nr:MULTISPECIES: dienelactone hydrolase family protein [unclassified Mesorhizobium]KQZ14002.1 carboxymethylenebutenolidase [Mesorhizobium sp. Root1471]KQZ36514.1 carboxymethylenebutenolidase [Mesorhizobium sp. Root554]